MDSSIIGVPLLYQREGFRTCVIILRPDGSITKGPGHAEVGWRWDGVDLVLTGVDGAATGRLYSSERVYQGRILHGISVMLRRLDWPCGYQFTGAVGEVLSRIRSSAPMRYILGIPFVNRRDLLEAAISSVPSMQERLIVIDNSNSRELRGHSLGGAEAVYEPPVPLTFVQSMNLLQQMAYEADCDVLCFMHNDARVETDNDRRFIHAVEETWRSNPRFGVLFTHYDALCAFNMTAVRHVGPWNTLFSQYFADNEYYGRLIKNGYERVSTDIVVKHHASMTLKADSRLAHANAILFPAYERIFRELCDIDLR